MRMASVDPADLFRPAILTIRRRPRLAGAVALLVLMAVVAAGLLGGAMREAGRWALRDASWIPGYADGLPYRPPEGVQARPLNEWRLGVPDHVQIQRDFQRPPGESADLALLLPAVNGDAALFINGVPTGPEVAAPETYLALRGARSSLWRIPGHFLRPGLNRLDLIVTGSRHRALDTPPVLGPPQGVDRIHAELSRISQAFRAPLPILALITAGLGLGAAGVSRSPLPWIALSAAAAAVGVRTLATDATLGPSLAPFGPVLDQAALSAALICLGCAISGPGSAVTPVSRTGLSGAVAVLFVLLLGLALAGADRNLPALELVGLGLPVLALICLVGAGRQGLRPGPARSVRDGLVEGGGLGLVALTSTAAVAGGAGLPWGLWVPALDVVYGSGVIVLLVGLAGVSGLRTSQGIWRWVRDRPRLSRIIQSQQQEIEAAALTLREQERRSAVLEERQRLSRDMHDGIGGQLTSLLARVRSRGITADQLEGELTSGLAELRLMVDSLDASDGPVADALAVLRSRVRTQGEAAGMALEWFQSEDLNRVVADPRWILNLNRLIQEAVTNAVRHSGGERLGVEVRLTDDDRLAVTVRDDGAGFERDQVQPGRGLSNLTFRAAQMGGSIRFSRGASGRGAVFEAIIAAPRPPAGEGHSTDEMMPN